MTAWNSIPGRGNSICKEHLECLRNSRIDRFARTEEMRTGGEGRGGRRPGQTTVSTWTLTPLTGFKDRATFSRLF